MKTVRLLRQRWSFFGPLWIAAGLMSVVSVGAADAPKNPFAVKGASVAPAPAPTSPLDRMELRGILTVAGTTMITLVDTSSNKAYVVGVGDTVEGYSVSDYRIQDDTVVVNSSGQTKRIQLGESKIVAAAVTAPPPPGAPNVPGAPQRRPATVAAQPAGQIQQISDEEVRRRMERVAEEVRRRRAMRREMMQQAQPGAQ